MEVRRATAKDKVAVLDMLNEFKNERSVVDGLFFEDDWSYEDWLAYNFDAEIGLNLPEGFVPAIQLVSFAEDGKALGFINIRLVLNDVLLNRGGHIGYSIRPSERGKGYAHEQLKQALELAKTKNIKRALLTCAEDNSASQRVIEVAGGKLEDIREGIKRYWIELGE